MVSKPCAHPGCRVLVPVGTTRCPAHQVDHQQERWAKADDARADRPSRKWYKRKAWQVLRQQTMARDGNCCQWPGCGVLLTNGKKQPNSAVCDHRIPHREDYALFHDPDNLWMLCKSCHDTHKQSLERRGARVPERRGEGQSLPGYAGGPARGAQILRAPEIR